MQNANDKLMKINDDHDTFIYSVSHDLNAPLNNMQGLIDNLREITDYSEIKPMTDMLEESIKKLKDTIYELADISRIEEESTDADQVNLFHMLEEVESSIKDLLQVSHAKINLHLDIKEIRFPKKNLRSIIFNLLSNSIKYRSPKRELEVNIASKKEGNDIVFSIQDNGIGINREMIPKIFSKFKRVHDLETNIDGTGIGLYLVKKFITNAGGRIEVESELGVGSCFRVYFKSY